MGFVYYRNWHYLLTQENIVWAFFLILKNYPGPPVVVVLFLVFRNKHV